MVVGLLENWAASAATRLALNPEAGAGAEEAGAGAEELGAVVEEAGELELDELPEDPQPTSTTSTALVAASQRVRL
jgi:hypothetical protein